MGCTYCEGQIYIDKSGAGFFYILPFQMDEAAARGIFHRWTAGSERAKGLEATAAVESLTARYFPVFMFRRDTEGGEEVLVEPARSTTLPGLHSLKVPPGDLKVFDQRYDTGGVETMDPNIEMVAYLESLPGRPKEQALVFFPIYLVEYVYRGGAFQAVIDGSSGEVFAADFPPRQAAGYWALGIGGFVTSAVAGLVLPSNPTAGGVLLVLLVPALLWGGLYVAKNM